MVRRGLAGSRDQARELVGRGQVLVAGAPTVKADRLVGIGEPLVVVGPGPRFVSRGGDKLDAALDRFGIAVAGRRCLDAGASTGGFTDCLMQRGAAHVWAVDVGHGQLHPRVRGDRRVTVRERCNVRGLTTAQTEGAFDLVVADLSFISLATVAAALVGLVAPGGDLVVLVKPQFEAGRAEASRGRGVIRDPAVWRRTLEAVVEAFTAAGSAPWAVTRSPLRGGDGNVEFLLAARVPDRSAGATSLGGAGAAPLAGPDLDAVVAG